MRVSKYIKADRDILLEYIYDDNNNIGDSYKVVRNIRENIYSYIAGSGSQTNNIQENQLVQLDPVTNNWGLVNPTTYTFLQVKDYPPGFPLRHDTIKIHLPINYTFGEYLGCFIKVSAFDFNNQNVYELSNFFFDITDINQSHLLNFNSPPLLFQEKLWGKNLTINIPSLYALSNSRVNNQTRENSVNFNLTNGTGMSLNSPVFIEFHFITKKRTINGVTNYLLTPEKQISLPQTPDFENLGVKIEPSKNGDFFEIYGVYNGDINQFDNFIKSSVSLGKRYYVNYNITLYEQNIRGKSFTINVTQNFNERVEWRPIIKFSTTTAIIDVEMFVIDAVDDSTIYRRASYGLLQDEVAKYSLSLTKINLSNASKPKIYNIKSPEGAGIFGSNGGFGSTKMQTMLEPIKVNFTVLADKFNVLAKSDSVSVGRNNFYGIGKLQIILQPFDNIIQIKIAQDITNNSIFNANTNTQELAQAPLYMDLSNMGEIKMVFKNSQSQVESGLYLESNQVDLVNGITVFKISSSKINDIRKIFDSGINVFYITSETDSGTTVIYSGLFTIYDTIDNVTNLNSIVTQIQSNLNNNEEPSIISDPNTIQRGTAIVTRRIVSGTLPSIGTTSSVGQSTTSVASSTKIGGVTYTIDTSSNLLINGYTWTPIIIKSALNLDTAPLNLTIKTDTLFTNNQNLGKLQDIKTKLEATLVTEDQKAIQSSIESNFLNT